MLKPADIPAKGPNGRLIKTTLRGWRDLDDELDGAMINDDGSFVREDAPVTIRVNKDGFVTDWCHGHDVENAVWEADPVE